MMIGAASAGTYQYTRFRTRRRGRTGQTGSVFGDNRQSQNAWNVDQTPSPVAMAKKIQRGIVLLTGIWRLSTGSDVAVKKWTVPGRCREGTSSREYATRPHNCSTYREASG